ncbi:MAG: hypothetical protein ACTSXQ_05085 [Alphaproteobacteria bacterium]
MSRKANTLPERWKKALEIEKQFQRHYKLVPHLGPSYADEKFSVAIEGMATSNKKLKVRIYEAYKYEISKVLWSFDYKKHLSENSIRNWIFLQKELKYKIGNRMKKTLFKYGFYDNCREDALYEYIKSDFNISWQTQGRLIPDYLSSIRGKAEKIAKAIYAIHLELEHMNR